MSGFEVALVATLLCGYVVFLIWFTKWLDYRHECKKMLLRKEEQDRLHVQKMEEIAAEKWPLQIPNDFFDGSEGQEEEMM